MEKKTFKPKCAIKIKDEDMHNEKRAVCLFS